MRGRNWIAAGMIALSLGQVLPVEAKTHHYKSHNIIERILQKERFSLDLLEVPPPRTDKISDLYNTTTPPTTTLQQYWPGAPQTVTVDHITPEVQEYRYLFTTIRNDQVVFIDDTFHPMAVFTLPQDSKTYREWSKSDFGRKRSIMLKVANKLKDEMKKDMRKHGIKDPAVYSNVGMADQTVAAINNLAPIMPYNEELFKEYFLDPRVAWLAINESDGIATLVSEAMCNGHYQIDDTESVWAGLIVPPPLPEIPKHVSARTRRRIITQRNRMLAQRKHQIDERFNPMLNAEAAAAILLTYSLNTGSVADGLRIYNSGIGNLAKINDLGYGKPLRNDGKDEDLERLVELHTGGKYQEVGMMDGSIYASLEVIASLPHPPTAMDLLEWAVTSSDIDENSKKYSSFQEASRRYVPAYFATLSAIDSLPKTKTPDFERVTLHPYKKIRGKDIAKAIGTDAFKNLDQHIPLDALIIDGVRVFVPLGEINKLDKLGRYDEHMTYKDGHIAGLQAPVLTPIDLAYIRDVTQPRFEGRYYAVTEAMMQDYVSKFTELYEKDRTPFRGIMLHMAQVTLAMYGKDDDGDYNFPQYMSLLKKSREAFSENRSVGTN